MLCLEFSEQKISWVLLGCWDGKIYLLCFFQACKSGIGTVENLLVLKDGIKHMENPLEREFGVFPLEPCPRRAPARCLSGCFLPRAPSCSQALFLGSFSHSPPRSISFPLSPERSRRGAGRGSGSRGGSQREPGTSLGGWKSGPPNPALLPICGVFP